MSVFKRGEVYHYRFMIKGKLYRGTTEETIPGRALSAESIIKRRALESAGVQRSRKVPILSEFALHFLKFVGDCVDASQLDRDTQRCYQAGWRLLSQTSVADMSVDEIGTNDARVLVFPGSPSNGNTALRTLRRILSYAYEVGLSPPAPRIHLLKEYGRYRRIDPSEEARLLGKMPRDVADVFLIMLDCGMRPEEVMRMRWDHVSWNRSEYFNPFGKSAESRRFVPMADRMTRILRARQGGSFSPWVFPGKTASGHRNTLNKRFEEARAAAGIGSDLKLYSARHEFATSYLECGGDVSNLQKLLGHASITTTMKYLHPDISRAVNVINRRNSRAPYNPSFQLRIRQFHKAAVSGTCQECGAPFEFVDSETRESEKPNDDLLDARNDGAHYDPLISL